MKEKITKYLPIIYALYTSLKASYHLVVSKGLFKSALFWSSIDNSGNPLPWFSYPAIDYLVSTNLRNKTVFEYGSGNSTIFFHRKAKSIQSVEDDPKWYRKIVKECPSVQLVNDKDNYIRAIKGSFDIIIIDGSYRDMCAKEALKHLKRGGFIIADDTNIIPKVKKVLDKTSLLPIPFIGPSPIGGQLAKVTTFYFKN